LTSKGLFWKLSAEGSPQEFSVLFGTIHLSIEARELREKICRWIDEFDYVYTETPLNPDGQSLILPHITVAHTKWGEYFNPRQQDRIANMLMKAYNLDIVQVKHLRPMFIMSMIYSHMGDHGASDKLDQFIWNYAIRQGKVAGGIESMNRQIEILKAIPIDLEFIQFRRWTRNVTKMNRYFKSLMQLYLSEDIHQLAKQATKQMSSIKGLMITDRNKQMVKTILDEHRQHTGFFSFGAGHLGGKDGVLSILKRRGFRIERI